MKINRGLTCALLAVSLSSTASRATEKPDVRATLIVPDRLAAGSKVPVVVDAIIGPGWHVNSHTPSEKFLIPTDVALSTQTGTLSAVRYPKDTAKRFSFSEKPLKVYEGTVRFESDLELPAAASGEVSIRGNLSYQACNELQCFAPAKIPLEAVSVISAAGGGR